MHSIIILSYTKDIAYYNMLKKCIVSIGTGYDIIVVETNSKLKNKNINLPCRFIFPDEEFNYNRFLNIGFSNLRNRGKVIISNNDVVYASGCINRLFTALDTYDSVSPTDKERELTIEGNTVGKEVRGWCIGMNYSVYEKMGQWDEKFSFWYQDNDYCNFLNKRNLKHALIGDAIAYHKTAVSHTLLKDVYASTHGLLSALETKWLYDD